MSFLAPQEYDGPRKIENSRLKGAVSHLSARDSQRMLPLPWLAPAPSRAFEAQLPSGPRFDAPAPRGGKEARFWQCQNLALTGSTQRRGYHMMLKLDAMSLCGTLDGIPRPDKGKSYVLCTRATRHYSRGHLTRPKGSKHAPNPGTV